MHFEDWLQQYIFVHIALVAIIGGMLAAWLARKLPQGWMPGLVGVVPAFLIGLLVSTATVFGWMVSYRPGALGVVASDPGGALQYCYLLGIEFGLLGMTIVVVVYAVARFRNRRRAVAA